MSDFKLELIKQGVVLDNIPEEMYWAYETVRQSGIYNMLIFHPIMGRYAESNKDEALKVMDDIYVKYCAYTNANIEESKYVHMTVDHVRAIQECYSLCKDYFKPVPEGVINLKRKVSIDIEF